MRILIRLTAIAAVVLTVASLVFDSLLYIPGLIAGSVGLIIYRRFKPNDMRPYFVLLVIATISAAIIFIVQGILGFAFFLKTT